MGTDVAEVVETLPYPSPFKLGTRTNEKASNMFSVKKEEWSLIAVPGRGQHLTENGEVHRGMCSELMKLLERTAKIFPEIEAARPRCSSGVQALCLLNSAIEKSKLLLQYCSEASKLYLAITADAIVLRCQRSRNLLEQSLSQIQNMVPVMLAVEISQIIDDLRTATFSLDSSDEEAGQAVRQLLQQGASSTESLELSEIKALQFAASRLCLTSPKAILIEKRSIKKLLDKVGDNDQSKGKVLKYLLHLLKKYGNSIKGEHKGNAYAEEDVSFSVYNQSFEPESHVGYGKYEAQTVILSRAIPPAEFKCPLSSRLMYDPVIIESGQTFERMWIQKWFDEGNDTCPKTKRKLVHQSLTPNTVIKDLISKWCVKYGITVSEPSTRRETLHSWDTSSTSISSSGSSINDLRVPLDVSNISLGSLDTSYSSDTSFNKIADGSNLMPVQTNDDYHRYQASTKKNEADLCGLSELNWEHQCKVIEDAESRLIRDNQAWCSLSSMDFVEPLIRFLRDAQNLHDVSAQRIGCRLLLAFVRKNRMEIPCLHEDVFCLLASLLHTEVTEETLAILEVLSNYTFCGSQIITCGALGSILNILDSRNGEFQKRGIKILHNLLSDNDICSHVTPSECISKLVPFLKDTAIAGHCLVILKNMCDSEDARVCIAETRGCLPSVTELLEIGSQEDQEHAVAILLSLCSQRLQYCELVMNEGVIPSLVSISINGNDKAKVSALELLRQLRDVEFSNEQECFGYQIDTSKDASTHPKEKKLSSKASGIFARKFPWFSKTSRSKEK